MTSTELAPTTGHTAPVRHRRAEPDVLTATGERISASAARKLRESVPRNSRDARSSRWSSYSQWCAIYGWATDEPNAVASYLSDLGDRGHPSKTLEAHYGTIRALRAVQGSPLGEAEIKACQMLISHRAGEEADDPLVEPGPLQADAVTLEELRLMVRTVDRTTVRGKQVAVTLLLDWWMAGRASEPARLNLHDVKLATVRVKDEAGRKVPRRALIVKIRRSKADQKARGKEVTVFAQDDTEICPVHAAQEWLDVLADDGQLVPGPFLRRIDRHGNIGARAAGRHTKDPNRRGGITAETVNDIIKAAASAAGLTQQVTPEERAAAARARKEAYAAAAAADTAEEANAIIKTWRAGVRAARAAVRRITGHSMRRGWIQTALDAGTPPEIVALHSRHSLKSSAFDAYRRRKLPLHQNPTLTLTLAA
ncbi:integrase [Streptomyces olivaceoviridis]|uniref:integrase n=1 Tax=Streptomyces olivaceoviridis TaxID=1921 RepID=UPI00332D9733